MTGVRTGDLGAVVLAAGYGSRLRPLTLHRPKALCPVGNEPLLDRMLRRLAGLGPHGPDRVAVNASWLADQLADHLGTRAHLSREPDPPLGTAGALVRLRDWIDGRPVLVANADAYLAAGQVDALLAGWDGETVRLLGVPAPPGEAGTFSGHRFVGISLLPWRWVRDLRTEPRELVTAVWRPAEAEGRLEVVRFPGYAVDTGTPAGYLAANLHAAGGGSLVAASATVTGRCERSVVGAGAVVHGRLTRSVVWPGGYVAADEHLVDAVRVGSDLTVSATWVGPGGR